MIILNKDNSFEYLEKVYNYLLKEKEYINYLIEFQVKQKDLFSNYMQKFLDSNESIKKEYLDAIVDLLKKSKIALEYCTKNIDTLSNLVLIYDGFEESVEKNQYDKFLDEVNIKQANTLENMMKNSIFIQDCLNDLIEFADLVFTTNQDEKIEEDRKNFKNFDFNKYAEREAEEIKKTVDSDYKENTLLISEMSGKVYLPFKLKDIEEKILENPHKNLTKEYIIEKEYTKSLDFYKNAPIVRFKEAFKLARKRSNETIIASFDLAMELLFSYNLHPAIITACKDLDELDIYLDYLEDNQTDKFNCFDIVFEIAPTISKKKMPAYYS